LKRPETISSRHLQRQSLIHFILCYVLPALATCAALVALDWPLLTVFYCATALGVAVGYHRHFSHRQDPAMQIDADAPNSAQDRPHPYLRIDHIAVAVKDLEPSIRLFRDVLGFRLVRRLAIKGARTGMHSAEMELNGIHFVLCQGTEPESQVSQLITHYGPGVAHVALEVADVHATVNDLKSAGMAFDTSVIQGPGLTQAFSSRCSNSGLCFEFIARGEMEGFLDSNVQQLFDELERNEKY
jgi:methylmalonyl-CoA/ethylmalonyl-CoA epimerase